ncbi:MAG: sulfatase [Bacteroidetes bacterium]|nr:sulfatase [Bacteroidota bacterium]
MNINKIKFRHFAILLTLIVIIGCKNFSIEKVDQKSPNILLVLADDQSWLHTGASGNKVIKTPAFDRITEEGVLFTNAFSACPSCTPSRTAILSGQEIWRTEEAGLLMGAIPKDLKLFTHILDDNSFHVGYTGKGWAPGNWDYLGLEKEPLIKEYNSRLEKEIAYGIDKRNYTANFKDFLNDRPKNSPFFFWFGSTEPHREYQFGVGEKEAGININDIKVPDFWPDNEIIRNDIADYYYEIMWYDTHLAGMIYELEQAGELENTIVIVTSDNGMPFPRAKVNLYDWGTHMPLAIRWGEKVKGGRKVDDLVSLTDLAPTILEAIGLQIPKEMTGKSLLSILTSEKEGIVEPSRDRVFTALERHTYCRPEGGTYPARAIRTHDYLYIRNFEPERWPTGGPDFISSNKTAHGDVDACPTKAFLIENENIFPEYYELNFGKRSGEELYDVHNDPGQINNLAYNPEYAEIKEVISKQLMDYLKETNDPRIEGNDPWQNYVYHQTGGFGSTYNKSLPAHERERAKLRPSDHPMNKLNNK